MSRPYEAPEFKRKYKPPPKFEPELPLLVLVFITLVLGGGATTLLNLVGELVEIAKAYPFLTFLGTATAIAIVVKIRNSLG